MREVRDLLSKRVQQLTLTLNLCGRLDFRRIRICGNLAFASLSVSHDPASFAAVSTIPPPTFWYMLTAENTFSHICPMVSKIATGRTRSRISCHIMGSRGKEARRLTTQPVDDNYRMNLKSHDLSHIAKINHDKKTVCKNSVETCFRHEPIYYESNKL